jgi:hypothetical protein
VLRQSFAGQLFGHARAGSLAFVAQPDSASASRDGEIGVEEEDMESALRAHLLAELQS